MIAAAPPLSSSGLDELFIRLTFTHTLEPALTLGFSAAMVIVNAWPPNSPVHPPSGAMQARAGAEQIYQCPLSSPDSQLRRIKHQTGPYWEVSEIR